ncbi:MAG: hypothetical protein N2315_06815 [Thermanaerothrix sp.]|nr:hypothetical protein [Thermanaerothrix sp.]
METRLAKGLEGVREELESSRLKGVGIIFSGSPGSVLLARIAEEVMGKDRVKLILVESPLWHQGALEFAARWALEFRGQTIRVRIREDEIQEILKNQPDRCYRCRKAIHRAVAAALPDRWGICDPLTVETLRTQKFGTRACSEDRVMVPLGDHGIGKAEAIGALSMMGLRWEGYRGVKCLTHMISPGLKLSVQHLGRLKVLGEAQQSALGMYSLVLMDPDTVVLKPLSDRRWGWEPVRDRLLEGGFKRVLLDVTGSAQPTKPEDLTGWRIPIRLLPQSPFE